jgi:ribonuclease HII
MTEEPTKTKKPRVPRAVAKPLDLFYSEANDKSDKSDKSEPLETVASLVPSVASLETVASLMQLSLDEVGRGCLFGRTYIACVVLPKSTDDSNPFYGRTDIKDSKKFSSKKKMKDVATFIKENALVWQIEYVENDVIDKINILKSVMRGMHECIRNVLTKLHVTEHSSDTKNTLIVVDGNYFTPYCVLDDATQSMREIPAVTVEQGDAKYMGIAAASILAKVARDEYISDLCVQYPVLSERYHLDQNMGYGTKAHMDGIREHGITQWHRRTFGELCKAAKVTIIA